MLIRSRVLASILGMSNTIQLEMRQSSHIIPVDRSVIMHAGNVISETTIEWH